MIVAAFSDPVLQAQATFRAVLDAAARPGTIVNLREVPAVPEPFNGGAGALALTLCDQDTPIWLDAHLDGSPELKAWLRFHTGARITQNATEAAFAFVGIPETLPAPEQFSAGTPEYPDRSTTLVLQMQSLRSGAALSIAGPGIRGTERVQLSRMPANFRDWLAANARLFPCGFDFLFATGAEILALPRSVRVVPESA